VTTIKQVYNAQTRWRKWIRGDKTKMQYLISKLEEHKYVYYTRANSEETTLEDIFFAHPESINMLNTFPTVLVMDSTYTSTKMTYSVGFSFLSFELEDNFTWALEMLVGLLTSKLNMSKVVVTDKDNALMNVVAKVLPETDAILYYFHIGKNVKAKCITNCRVKAKPKEAKEVNEAKEEKHCDIVEKITRVWKEVVESPIEDSYASALLKFKDVCEPFPKFLAYVETTVLIIVKKKFVRA
jgi:DNA-directed RNA polymerase subunit L